MSNIGTEEDGLTGFDSKWVNTLYLDKVLRYENIIQPFPALTVYSGQKSLSAL